MRAYFKFEFIQFMFNKKNIAVYVILLFFACFYALKIAPAYDPIEKVDREEIEARFLTREDFLNNVVLDENTYPLTRFAAAIYPEWNEYDKQRLDALAAGDMKKYAEATFNWYVYSDNMIFRNGKDILYYNSRYYTAGNLYATEDGHYAYMYSASRFDGYAKGDSNLSINVFEERTALQTLQRLLHSYLPLILLISCILFAADIVLKDKKNPSLIKGFPISVWRSLLVKGGVALTGSILTVIPLAVGFVIIAIRNGIGDLNLPVPVFSYKTKAFTTISMGEYLFQNALLILFWFFMLISLLLLVSIIVKNEFANLVAGCVVVFAEYYYYVRGLGYVKDIHWYPSSYVQVGQIIAGYREYLNNSVALTLKNGLLVMAVCTVICLLLTFIISNHRRYKLL
ncbi:ABC transporter permease [Ureibacillus chungkukjangi]|uniref:ABC-2 type transport system permease protein n=1 Tax=Ureibacillus chungkukjangi TaxID=1202712 RepID=A0A318TU70_9BACL|nr:ABC transporter permease [Ureibacillus chungkukjangi]PYF08342.1 ABC-2 type transport system permease protein [Ureibacillus chungkukjangi]